MSADALVMMIIAITIVWGGLVAAVIRLHGHPEHEPPPDPTPERGGQEPPPDP